MEGRVTKPAVSFSDLLTAFHRLELDPRLPVIAHASLSSFGYVPGGERVLIGVLLASSNQVMMPAFTYKTMLIPEVGPQNNGLEYGLEENRNRMAEFFQPEMPVDRLIGAVPEALRQHPQAARSSHPILSFTGVNVEHALQSQSLNEPLAPIRVLAEEQGWVLLLGVSHNVNTSIHVGERMAGRKQFTRWALTPDGVLACPGFPGCSDGFDDLAPMLEASTRRSKAGAAVIQALPLTKLLEATRHTLEKNPLALLCSRDFCERCQSIRSQNLAYQQSS